ncbi:hypothetical protein ACXYMU_01080 [Pontibacter sp. CAU 1760]
MKTEEKVGITALLSQGGAGVVGFSNLYENKKAPQGIKRCEAFE